MLLKFLDLADLQVHITSLSQAFNAPYFEIIPAVFIKIAVPYESNPLSCFSVSNLPSKKVYDRTHHSRKTDCFKLSRQPSNSVKKTKVLQETF